MANETVINPALEGALPAAGDPVPEGAAPAAGDPVPEGAAPAADDPVLPDASATLINQEILAQYNLENGIESSGEPLIDEGTELCGRYKVVRPLEVASGEADLYLCTCGGAEYAAKVYKRRLAIKEEVIDKLMTLDSPYVARLYETGIYNGCPVEILPYFENGSWHDRLY